MPQVVAENFIPVARDVAFRVSQTTGETRMRWDPFIRHQHLMDGAETPGRGVRTLTKARVGPRMISRYVSYQPPSNVGMTMESGPWFFDTFGGGWRFHEAPGGTRAVWKYTFSVKPRWLRPVAEPVGVWLLGREIRTRIQAFARACVDPVVLDAVERSGR